MKASDLLVNCLENEGVEYIFGIVGSEVIDLTDSLSKTERITYIPVRHEQGAAFMADVYGRVSGKPGVCLATLGPGATNLITGIASANLDHSPVVAITGQKCLDVQHKNAHQYVDIVRIFEPAAKWSVQIKDANTIPEIVRKSFRLSLSEKPGAVVIELPENIAKANVTTKPLSITPISKSVPAEESLIEAVQLLHQCKKPFIIIGNGVIRQEAVQEVQTFIERLGCPTANSFMAKGVLLKEHPQNYFTFGFKEKDYVLRGMEESDLLVVIGFDLNEKLPSEWNMKKVSVLHIDPLPAEVEEGYPVKGELVGNLKETLRLLLEKDVPPKSWEPSGDLKKRIEDANSINDSMDNPDNLTVENILHVLEKISSEQTVIISDVGAHKVAAARTFQPKHAKQLVISNGLASMGISIPGAIGAKLAAPEKTVIVLTGDGGALMNFAELETAKRLGLNFIIILLNDSMLKLEVETMNKAFGENYGVTFSNPDFVKLAESFGVTGMRASHITEFEEILATAVGNSNDIFLIDTILQEN